MKKLLLPVIFMFLFLGGSFGQQQNPSLSNPAIDPNPYTEGGTGTATLTFLNLIFPIPLDASNPMTIDITFGRIQPMNDPAIVAPTGGGAGFFDWSITGNGNGTQTVQGVQNQSIPGFTALGEIIFDVDVTGLVGQVAGFNANLGGNLNDLTMNIPDDDNVTIFIPIAPASVLPVELLSFTGRKVDRVVKLDWTTVTEQNNEGFEILKSSDGRDWDIIGWVDGNGTATQTIDYTFIDKFPFIGENYYRLKQIDHDGQFEFSNIIIVNNIGGKAAINVLPNPTPGPFSVAVENPKNEKMKISLFDSAGQIIYESGLIENEMMWRKDFDLMPKEMYFISVQIGEEILTEKILVINRT